MSDFRKLSESVLASPQLTANDIGAARTLGVTRIVNNRPEEEEPGQTPGAAIEAAAREAGIDYVAIPISHGNFGEAEVGAMVDALDRPHGKVLAYCRTGTRSTLLWALAQAAKGEPLTSIAAAAAAAGYDVSPVLPAMTVLAGRASAL
jgi:uncharacterized protein (TIGR01244 family)